MKKFIPYIILTVVFTLMFLEVDAQCSQCKLLAGQSGLEAIDEQILDKKNGNMINSAILYIMMIPYLILLSAVVVNRKNIVKHFKDIFAIKQS